MSERIVRATWAGWCEVCRTKYRARTDIKQAPSGKWVHADASECKPAEAKSSGLTRRQYNDLYNEGGEGYNPLDY